VKINTCVGIAKLYEYLALNAIPIFEFISIQPIDDLSNMRSRPNPKCNTHMKGHFKITSV
jgi:hypothetical protein